MHGVTDEICVCGAGLVLQKKQVVTYTHAQPIPSHRRVVMVVVDMFRMYRKAR